jgi:hypothetical protein
MAGAKSEYLQYLPQILRGSEEAAPGFLNGYLKVFEALFSGRNDTPITARAGSIPRWLRSMPPPRARPPAPRSSTASPGGSRIGKDTLVWQASTQV